MNIRYCCVVSLFLSALSPLAIASERFKGVDLWLPSTYQKQYSKMLEAAEKARSDPYCFQLLSGRILEEKSSVDHMQFYFRCRSESRESFSIQVDGNTLALTNTYAEKQKNKQQAIDSENVALKQQQDAEAARAVAEQVAARRKEQSQYWQICRKEMRKRLKTFEDVTILTESLPEPEIQMDQFTYTVLFDSKSPSKKTLHFQALCTISALDYYSVSIKPRKITGN